MKKLVLIAIITFLINNLNCFACNLSNIFTTDRNKKEVYSIIKKHTKAIQKNNIEKLETFYHKDYISTDGFNIDDLIAMLNQTRSIYKHMKYKTKINNITAYDNWALVQLSDKTKAIIFPDKEEKLKEKTGLLEGSSTWNLYLKKENNSWKIISEDILIEETSLRYGIAKKIDMNLITPVFIKSGEEYDISLKIKKPKNIIALASIANEEIVYPPQDFDDKFRKLPEDGDLERLVKANDKNINEYGIASIGFTKFSINEEETRAKIEVLGMAHIMKRINIEKNKTHLSAKGEVDAKK